MTHHDDVLDRPEGGEFLTVGEFAKRLRVPSRTVRRMIRSGDLHGVLVGKKALRIPSNEITRLLLAPFTTEPTKIKKSSTARMASKGSPSTAPPDHISVRVPP